MGKTFEVSEPHEVNGVTVLAVSGVLDLNNASALKGALIDAISLERSVVLDVANVDYIDSTHMGVLVGSYKRLNGLGRKFAVANPDANVRKILEITGLDKFFAVEDSLADAISKVKEG